MAGSDAPGGWRLLRLGRLPARELERQRRRSTGNALDIERPAEQPDALADPDESEAPTLRGLDQRLRDVESAAVVDDLRLEAVGAAMDPYEHLGRAAVLAHVGEALLHDPEKSDSLRGRERLEV